MFKSLRWRIQFWHAAILATVILLFAGALYLQQRRSQWRTIDNELSAAMEVLQSDLRSDEPDELQVPRTFAPRRLHHAFELPYFVIWTREGQLLHRSSDFDPPGPPPVFGDSVLGSSFYRFRYRGPYREVFAEGPQGTTILVGRHVEKDRHDLQHLLLLLIGIGTGVFSLGLAGGWVLSKDSVRPIEEISRVATMISETNLSGRIASSTMDLEFASLADTLNATFVRLEAAFVQQQRFTADASHELRTPLSVIQMHQDLALSKTRSADEYRETLETCRRATDRMNFLVESLLTLARIDGQTLEKQDFDLQELITQTVETLRGQAEINGISFQLDAESCDVRMDRERIGQVITNLLVNAITYSSPNSVVDVSIGQASGEVSVAITNSGIGIAEEHLSKIFDRFYRVDDERSRNSGGSGLGLAICKSIVEAHGGNITAESGGELTGGELTGGELTGGGELSTTTRLVFTIPQSSEPA